MKLIDATEQLVQQMDQNTFTIYMPSLKKDIKFKRLVTEDLKVLSRIGVFNQFDLNNQLLKLSLFDKLVAERIDLNSDNLSLLDFLSFMIGLRKFLNNELSYTFTCQNCQQQFTHHLDLQAEFSKFIFGYQKKVMTFEKIDSSDNIWKFQLTNYTMKNFLYYRYYIERLKQIDMNNPDLLNQEKFLRPMLYISKIYKNDQQIQDWGEQLIGTKINFYNSLPIELTIDSTGNDSQDYLASFVEKTFDQEKFLKAIDNIVIKCSNKECGEQYAGMYTFDDFCVF